MKRSRRKRAARGFLSERGFSRPRGILMALKIFVHFVSSDFPW